MNDELPSKQIYITADMDWASDEVLKFFLDFMKDLNIHYTLTVTHYTPLLEQIKKDPMIELGIHPNFNFLLDGIEHDNGSNSEDVIDRIKRIVPGARVTRSHSMTASSRLSAIMQRSGITIDLNLLYPPRDGDVIRPWEDVWGITHVPFIFEDDIYSLTKNRKELSYYLSDSFVAPRVLNFHPIHVFLNTDKMDLYENARPYLRDFSILKSLVNEKTVGARDWLSEVVTLGKREEFCFDTISGGRWE